MIQRYEWKRPDVFWTMSTFSSENASRQKIWQWCDLWDFSLLPAVIRELSEFWRIYSQLQTLVKMDELTKLTSASSRDHTAVADEELTDDCEPSDNEQSLDAANVVHNCAQSTRIKSWIDYGFIKPLRVLQQLSDTPLYSMFTRSWSHCQQPAAPPSEQWALFVLYWEKLAVLYDAWRLAFIANDHGVREGYFVNCRTQRCCQLPCWTFWQLATSHDLHLRLRLDMYTKIHIVIVAKWVFPSQNTPKSMSMSAGASPQIP